MIYLAILGHGVVGSCVAQLLRKNAESIAHKAAQPLQVKRILDLREFPICPMRSCSPNGSRISSPTRRSASWWRPWGA